MYSILHNLSKTASEIHVARRISQTVNQSLVYQFGLYHKQRGFQLFKGYLITKMKSASNSFTTSNGSGKHQCASNSIAIHERRRVSDFNTSILVVDLLTAIPQYSNTDRYKHMAFDCHPIDKFILGFKWQSLNCHSTIINQSKMDKNYKPIEN